MKNRSTRSRSRETGSTSSSWGFWMGLTLLFFVVIPRCTSCKHPVSYFLDDPRDPENWENPEEFQDPEYWEEVIRELE